MWLRLKEPSRKTLYDTKPFLIDVILNVLDDINEG
jgi:hypothetical protein